MQPSRLKNNGNGLLALFFGLIFGLISVNGIVTEGKIGSFNIIYFLENNYGFVFVLIASIFLIFTYIVSYSENVIKLIKQKEWVNLFYPFWFISVLSPVLKNSHSFYLRLLPVILPIITIYLLINFHSKITGKTIKEYLSETFNPKKEA